MDIIAPVIQQPYHVQPVVPTKGVDGVLQHNLILHQVVQATVIEGGHNQIVLELGQHKMPAHTEQPLTTGQKLNLQVVTTQPQLKLQIVGGKADPSVLRLLHLFDHRSELGPQLSKLLSQRPTAEATTATRRSGMVAPAVAPTATPTMVESGQVVEGAVLQRSTGETAAAILQRPTALASELSAVQRQAVEGALSPGQWGQLEHLSSRLMGELNSSDSRLLVNLARMLGMDFEALLARDQVEQANQGLKGMLLSLQENSDLPESVRENSSQMVQQLEVLQLCRLRLAQEGVLFLPLPLDFLEQGYVLFEQQSPESDSDGEAAGHLVSLNLTLQQLGAMQVNLLFEQQALFVRIKCADEETAILVEGYCEELHESLQPFSVRSIQVTTGAEDPALVLLRRLQDEKHGQHGQSTVLDARV